MKKFYLILCAAIMLAACGKNNPEIIEPEETTSVQELVFDFTVHYPGEKTKAVKEGWESGDKVFIFFEDVTTGYVTMTYGASAWNDPVFNGTANIGNLTASGKNLTAVYLPFGNSATASYDEGWKFSTTYYSYYMRAEKVSYTVDSANGITTLSAEMDMVNPEGYVQFFVEEAAGITPSNGVYTLGCDAVTPVGVASIAADGTIHETSDKSNVDDMPGYVYSGGYLFSGKLSSSYVRYAGYKYNGYYFAKSKSDNTRVDYAIIGKTLSSHSAVKLPANDSIYENDGTPNNGKWVPVGAGITVCFGEFTAESYKHYGNWYTCNYGATWPENEGTSLTYVDAAAEPGGVTLGGKLDFQALVDNCNYEWMQIHGHYGLLLQSRPDNEKESPFGFLFLPSAGNGFGAHYWTGTVGDSEDSAWRLYFQALDYVSFGIETADKTNSYMVRYKQV